MKKLPSHFLDGCKKYFFTEREMDVKWRTVKASWCPKKCGIEVELPESKIDGKNQKGNQRKQMQLKCNVFQNEKEILKLVISWEVAIKKTRYKRYTK